MSRNFDGIEPQAYTQTHIHDLLFEGTGRLIDIHIKRGAAGVLQNAYNS